jgi:hypothetical protein
MPKSLKFPVIALAFGLALPMQAAFAVQISKGDVIDVQIDRDSHMKVGETVRARTVYPVYVNNRLVVPSGAELVGKITALDAASKKTRVNAKLGGDFTPLHTPRIQFDHLVFSNGTDLAINTLPSSGGIEVVRFQALSASAHQPSLAKKLWSDAVGREKETVHTFTAPGKEDRLRRALYSELPYHPELLTEGTQFSVQLASAVDVPMMRVVPDEPAEKKGVDSTVTLAAELLDGISSKNAVRGTKVRAVVTEPLLNENQQVQVPQGTLLLGEITQAVPAAKWGKGGTLRFSFRELQFPAGFVQKVHGAPVAIDAAQNSNVELDAEGGVKPASKGAMAPLLMGLLAMSAVHEDEVSVLHTGGASNGFALIGRAAALAAKSNYVGAAIGFYGTGRAVYSRWIAHGENITFPRHTRIEVALDPDRVNTLKPPVAK